MATSQLNGVHYAVDGDEITFFDVKGMKLDGDRWAINAFGGDTYFPVRPGTLMPTVHGCINDDVEKGKGDKLSMLLLAPQQAVIFYLEGRLTRQQLASANEGLDFIDIPNVDIDGRNLTVRVLREPQHTVATADNEGNVL